MNDNQNQLNGIDPKLAEKFHQIMNTPTSASAATPPAAANPAPATPIPAPITPVQPETTPAPTSTPAPSPVFIPTPPQMPETPAPATQPTPYSMQVNTSTPPQMPQLSQNGQTEEKVEEKTQVISTDLPQTSPQNITNSQIFSSKKQGGKISPVIVVLGTAVFLVIYTIVWVKVFNLSLPFLP